MIRRRAPGWIALALVAGGCSSVQAPVSVAEGARALEQGEPTVAASYFAAADSAAHGAPEVRREIASIYLGSAHKEQAAQWLDRIAEAEKTSSARIVAALFRAQLGHLEPACSELSREADRAGATGEILNDYAYLCLVAPGRDLDRAVGLLTKAVALTPIDSPMSLGAPQSNLPQAVGAILAGGSDPRTAIVTGPYSQQGTEIDSLGWAYVRRYQQHGDPADLASGMASLENAAVKAPIPEVRSHLAIAYRLSGRTDAIHPLLQTQWVVEDALGAALLSSRGSATRLRRALDLFQDAVNEQPNDAWVRYHLGQAWRSLGEMKDAEVELSHARLLDASVFHRSDSVQGLQEAG